MINFHYSTKCFFLIHEKSIMKVVSNYLIYLNINFQMIWIWSDWFMIIFHLLKIDQLEFFHFWPKCFFLTVKKSIIKVVPNHLIYLNINFQMIWIWSDWFMIIFHILKIDQLEFFYYSTKCFFLTVEESIIKVVSNDLIYLNINFQMIWIWSDWFMIIFHILKIVKI